ncbi:Mis12-Mtw1 protein family-domain-containing protein [Scleroderma yunnanense]
MNGTKRKTQANGKRKLIGEEQPGGLVIVRASSQNHSSSQPLVSTSSLASTSQPPSKKLKADSFRAPTGAKQRDVPAAPSREDPELDEDIRQMEDETDDLRRRSRAKESKNHSHGRYPPDTLQPLHNCETPKIQRNKLLRVGQPHTPQAQTPRRTSMSMRGKRISTSFENTGVISQPHASVSDSSFYKHIDCDLPEPQRARQLLIWSAARALTRLSEPLSSSTKPSKPPSKGANNSYGKDPPPLDDDKKALLRTVQEDFIRMLAERKIDTSVYPRNKTPSKTNLKPNEQNVKNRAREVTFQKHIDRAQAEAEGWQHVDHFYHAYQVNSRAELECRYLSFKPPSAKSKGKQRAISQEPFADGDWSWLMPNPDDLSPRFKSRVDLQRIRDVMASEPRPGTSEHDPLDRDIDDLRWKLDNVFVYVNSAVQMTDIVEAEINRRFMLLSHALSTLSLPPPPLPRPPSQGSSSTGVSAQLPLVHRRPRYPLVHPPGESPRDILRALSRIDKDRPPGARALPPPFLPPPGGGGDGNVGAAAEAARRRAVREVQRVQEGGSGGVGERRLTGLPLGVGGGVGVGNTPRKVLGTPRRW